MATRTCPYCHRRIVAADARCCYCGRASTPSGVEPAEVIALDRTPFRSGIHEPSPSGVVSDLLQHLAPPGAEAHTDAAPCNDDPPNDAGDLLRLRDRPSAKWAFNLIALALAVSLLTLIFPKTRPWFDPLRLLLAVAGQYLVICTAWHQWSFRLLITGLWPAIMPNHLPVRAWSWMHVFFIMVAFASTVAQFIGLWRRHTYHLQAQGLGDGHADSAQSDRPDQSGGPSPLVSR
jgi:hypothetical protein